jgi:hypothetical protein
MALTVENGSLVANANSYVSAADFASWADARGISYPALPELEQKILRAMDYIESLDFLGQKHEETQALQWPRDYVYIDGYSVESDEIPKEVKVAVYEATKADIDGDSRLAVSDRETISETIGNISVTYKSSSGMKRSIPAVSKALRKLVRNPSEVGRV